MGKVWRYLFNDKFPKFFGLEMYHVIVWIKFWYTHEPKVKTTCKLSNNYEKLCIHMYTGYSKESGQTLRGDSTHQNK